MGRLEKFQAGIERGQDIGRRAGQRIFAGSDILQRRTDFSFPVGFGKPVAVAFAGTAGMEERRGVRCGGRQGPAFRRRVEKRFDGLAGGQIDQEIVLVSGDEVPRPADFRVLPAVGEQIEFGFSAQTDFIALGEMKIDLFLPLQEGGVRFAQPAE